MDRKRTSRRLAAMLALTFALTILSFTAATLVSESIARGTNASAQLIEHTLPDFEYLTRVREELGRTNAVLDSLTETDFSTADLETVASEIRASQRRRNDAWQAYLTPPLLSGEPELITATESNMRALDISIDRALAALRTGKLLAARDEVRERALPALAGADEDVRAASDLNRRTATEAAGRIRQLREESSRWGILLDAASGVLAIVAAYFVIRVVRRFSSLTGERLLELEGFGGRVAHDIRSPLGTVSLALDLAKRQPELTPPTRGYLDRASRTLERVGQLVDGLLVFALAGKPPPEEWREKSTSVRGVLDGIVEDARPNAEAKGIAIEYDAPPTSLGARCSAGVLASLASNLVTNAIKYMGEAPVRRVAIRVREVARCVRVEVRDTGPGVPVEMRARLFDPYVRGADSTIPGLGLGLATVRRLAEAHGGNVGMDPARGGGSIFWFELPKETLVDAEDAASRPLRELHRATWRES